MYDDLNQRELEILFFIKIIIIFLIVVFNLIKIITKNKDKQSKTHLERSREISLLYLEYNLLFSWLLFCCFLPTLFLDLLNQWDLSTSYGRSRWVMCIFYLILKVIFFIHTSRAFHKAHLFGQLFDL